MSTTITPAEHSARVAVVADALTRHGITKGIAAITSQDFGQHDLHVQAHDFHTLLAVANAFDLDLCVSKVENRPWGNATAGGVVDGVVVDFFTTQPTVAEAVAALEMQAITA